MKLHKIELKNLNSIYGHAEIDLGRDLKDAPIFLIVGPTGSGKSTLMDAVCLALFGQTPRLSRDKGKEDKDSRMVMSHGTGECMAAVEFSKRGADGLRRRYRAIWSCHKARKKPDGKLQEAERSLEEILEEGPPKLLAGGKLRKAVEPVFNEVLEDLTVEDFQRSVLLAQGEFAAFLKADDKQRASILERLTRTELYKRIGERAAQEKRRREADLQKLEAKHKGVVLLSEDEVAAIRVEAKQIEGKLAALEARITQLNQAERYLSALNERIARCDEARQRDEDAARALEARTEDAARLSEDARCQPAAITLRKWREDEAAVRATLAELPSLEASEASLVAELGEARRLEQEAELERQARAGELEATRPALIEARSLRQAWQVAEVELGRAKESAEESRKRAETSWETLDARERELAQAAGRRDEAARALAALAHAEPLAAKLAGLEVRFQHLVELDAQRARELEVITRARAKRDGFSAASSELARGIEDALVRRTSTESAHAEARAKLVQLCAGAASPRARREQLSEEGRRIRQSERALEEIAAAAAELRALSDRRDKADAEIARFDAAIQDGDLELARLLGKSEALADGLRTRQEELGALELIRKLEQERASLSPGNPCPLCGSLSHPFREKSDEGALRREIEGRYALAKRSFEEARAGEKAHQEAIVRLKEELGAQRARREARHAQRATEAARAAELAATIAARGKDAGLDKDAERDAIEARRATLELELHQIEATQRALDEAVERECARERELSGLNEGIGQKQREKETLDARIEEGDKRIEERQEGLNKLDESAQSERRTIMLELEELGLLGEEREPDLARALERARQLCASLRAAEDAWEQADKAAGQLTAARDKVNIQLEEANKQREAAEAELERRRAGAAEARDQALSCLEGQDPDKLEQALSEAHQKAEALVGEARKRVAELSERQASIRARREAVTTQLEARQREEKERRAELDRQLEELGLADKDALEQRILPDDERTRLSAELRQLKEARAVARTRREEEEAHLSTHRTEVPPGIELGEVSAEELSRELGERESERRDRLEALGRCRERLDEHERKSRELSRVAAELTETRKEYAVWKQLYDLIGVRDGEQFKEFAQILNLEELIEKANARLKWLSPRYSLTIARDTDGRARLGFAVSDAFHAGAERPLTTLSGGETFLISLALALALSDYRTVQMPIETLLLDEGFGTLDADTLNTAMDALERLQARGTQVGIISHVEGLKERIEARIVLERLGNGRSGIKFELGASAD